MTNTLAMPNQYPSSEERQPLGPIFAIGQSGMTEQYLEGDTRFFEWRATPYDEHLKDLAGWGKLITETLNGSTARLVLPGDVRSASNVLPGIEAFEGEKRTIVDFMTRYTKSVFDRYGEYDTSMNLDTIGVGRGNNQVLVLPPHHLTTNEHEVSLWMGQLHADLEDLLVQDPKAAQLIQAFEQGMLDT